MACSVDKGQVLLMVQGGPRLPFFEARGFRDWPVVPQGWGMGVVRDRSLSLLTRRGLTPLMEWT